MTSLTIQAILAAYRRWGDRLYGERVTQSQHALQCAALAAADGASDALIVAALLHDYGHLTEAVEDTGAPGVDARHETTGARGLSELFGPAVTRPIALHVAAKRWLCAVEPAYLATLSPASLHSLALQGGPFTADEAASFARLEGADEAVRLRRWDDLGKQAEVTTPGFAAYAGVMRALASDVAARRRRPDQSR